MSHQCKGCIACPQEVRALYAIAFNTVNLWKNRASDPDRFKCKIHERMRGLEDAVKELQPFVEAHFGDNSRARGPSGSLPEQAITPRTNTNGAAPAEAGAAPQTKDEP